jgi:hypothetical protein
MLTANLVHASMCVCAFNVLFTGAIFLTQFYGGLTDAVGVTTALNVTRCVFTENQADK